MIKRNDLKKMNKSRKDVKIIKGGYEMRKNVVQDKILDKFLGSYKIYELYLEKGNVWLDEGNRIVRHNIKNIKPFVGGGECHVLEDSHLIKSDFNFKKFLEKNQL
ncbi:hypothetical protein DMUE_0207 [Dictyocoela muelleri]|nr:hypothetical protein DMUE_0207 [Dictyocoela muelleri]